jgi:hypothetical protein
MYAVLLPFFTLTISLHAKSQTSPKLKPPSWVGIPVGSTRDGASQAQLKEYSAIVSKYGDTGRQWWIKFEQNVSMEDRNRLEQLFKQMSMDQQNVQKVAFVKTTKPLEKVIPSGKEFTAWINGNVYGVWIDGKRVDNAVLNHYQNTNFEQVTVSKLYGAAKRNKNYFYQVNLMTKAYYRKYLEQAEAKREIQMVFRD